MAIHYNQTRFVKTAVGPEGYPKDRLPHIAIVGRSNVGKSSLLNALFKQKGLAKTSSTPGKTQALQFFNVDDQLLIADLPGYGYSKVSRAVSSAWGPMIQSYLTNNEKLRKIILLLDLRHDPSAQDLQFIEWATALNLPLTIVCTKADKLSKGKRVSQAARFSKLLKLDSPPLITSAPDGVGREALARQIAGVL